MQETLTLADRAGGTRLRHEPASARLQRDWATNGLPLVCAWLALSLVLALLLFIFYMTFVPSLPVEPGLTLDHWGNIATPRMLTRIIPNTVFLGIGTILVASFFALPLAWLLNRTTLPFRNTFITLLALVPTIPGFVLAIGWVMLLNERIGLLNLAIAALSGQQSVPLSVSDNLAGIAWVMGLILTPGLFFLIAGPMRSMDPALEEAAMASGAGPWQTPVRIDLPLLWPGILGGLIYTFMTAVSIFEIPALLGAASDKVPVMASELFYAVRPGGPQAATFAYGAAGVYGLLLAAPSLMGLYFYLRLLAQSERYQVITGKGYRPRDVELGRYTWLGLAFVGLYLTLAVVLPMLTLVWASLLPVLALPSAEALAKVSLANYAELLPRLGGPAIIANTLVIALVVSSLVCFFSLMISWIVVRTRVRLRNAMDIIAMLPHAIPGIAFAFALAMFGIVASIWLPWLPAAGTLGIIVVAHFIHRLPYGTRVCNMALGQIHRDLEEAAQVCGARNVSMLWRITVPLIRPSLLFLALWTAILSMQEVSMALFLAGPHNRVLSVSIWTLWTGSSLGPAAAGAVAMAIVLGVLVFVALRVTGGTPNALLVGPKQAPEPARQQR